MTAEENEIVRWVREHFTQPAGARTNLIAVLQAMQEKFGYLAKAGLKEIAEQLGMTPANVYGVATFYNQFRFVPPGKHPIKVCMGTACAIKRGRLVLEHWERRLGIKVGGVTADREYSLDRVDCIGCCTMAPVAVMGDQVIGEMAVTKVDGLLLQHRLQKEQAARAAAGEIATEKKP